MSSKVEFSNLVFFPLEIGPFLYMDMKYRWHYRMTIFSDLLVIGDKNNRKIETSCVYDA